MAWPTFMTPTEVMEFIDFHIKGGLGLVPCEEEKHQTFSYGDGVWHHMCDNFYIPAAKDLFPRLHSIMLPTADRWDAHNRKWMDYRQRPFAPLSNEEFDKMFLERLMMATGRASTILTDGAVG